MKKAILVILFISIFSSTSCVSTGNSNTHSNFEAEINNLVLQISDYLIERLPENTPVSLINISENEQDLANAIFDRVSSELVNSNRLIVVARDNLKPVEIEQGFQLSNASEESLVRIGNFLGAQVVISCRIARQSGMDRLFVQALDSSTGIKRADKSFELAFLSSEYFSISTTERLPPIERVDTHIPMGDCYIKYS